MKHKKCGGKFVRVEKIWFRKVYKCNRCGVSKIVYRKSKLLSPSETK